jgi:hypothetical protein
MARMRTGSERIEGDRYTYGLSSGKLAAYSGGDLVGTFDEKQLESNIAKAQEQVDKWKARLALYLRMKEAAKNE